MLCKKPILIKVPYGKKLLPQDIRCGQCMPCRIKKRHEWTLRCLLESKMYPQDMTSFITLTYNDKNLPANRSISKKELQAEHKRFHQNTSKIIKNSGYKLKYYGIGEYGLTTNRPHYHKIIYGIDIYRHQYSGDIKISNEKIKAMLQDCNYTSSDINNLLKNITPIEREIYRSWQYKGTIKVLPADYGTMQYTAGHNTKVFTDTSDINKRHKTKDYQLRYEEGQMEPFHSLTPALGYDYVKKNLVPAYKKQNIYPYEHPNMIADKSKQAIPVEELDKIRLSVNGKMKIQQLPTKLVELTHKELGGNIYTDEQKFQRAKYNRDELRDNLIKTIGKERVLTVESISQSRTNRILENTIKNNKKYETRFSI